MTYTAFATTPNQGGSGGLDLGKGAEKFDALVSGISGLAAKAGGFVMLIGALMLGQSFLSQDATGKAQAGWTMVGGAIILAAALGYSWFLA